MSFDGDLLHRFSIATGTDLLDFGWYQGFAWFKLAVILAGVDHRAIQGQAAGQEFAGARELVEPCIERGLVSLGGAF